MSGELSLKDYCVKNMKARAHVVKHADGFTPGISDLSLFLYKEKVTRWIELKAEHDWPSRLDTKMKLDCYTEAQALFLRLRLGFLLVRVRGTYMLFRSTEAWSLWADGGWTRHEMLRQAHKTWYNFILWGEFVKAIV